VAAFADEAFPSPSPPAPAPATNVSLETEINWLNLGPIRDRIMNENEWDAEYANAVVKEYKRFLLLHKLFPEQRLVPSLHVDEAWHAHILFTHKYARECLQLFGHFLHHDPSTSEEEIVSDADTYTDVVLKLYETAFGEPAGPIWRGRESGKCCSGKCTAEGEAKCGSKCSGKCGGGEFTGKCGSGKCSGKCGATESGKCGSGKCSGKCGSGGEKSAKCGSRKCSGRCGGAGEKSAKCGSGKCSGKCGAAKAAKCGSGKCSGRCGGSAPAP